MKTISDLTVADVKAYANIFHDEDDDLLELVLNASKSFVLTYTGLSIETANTISDLPICVLVISNEMYDNRVYIVDNDKVNQVVKTILGMHAVNYLGSYETSDGS